MRLKTPIMLFASLSLLVTISASAASPIVEKMKQADQQHLKAEKYGCGIGCYSQIGLYRDKTPELFEMPNKYGTLTPEQVYLLDQLKAIVQKEAEIIDWFKTNDRARFEEIRADLQSIILDMLTFTAQMKEVSANELKVLTLAVSKAHGLYANSSWQEYFVSERDTKTLYAYMEGIVAVLDRFQNDLPNFYDYIPGGSYSPYSWAHSVTMRSLAEFTKTLETNYPDTVQELLDTYTRNYLKIVQADTRLNLDDKIRNAMGIYIEYKMRIGTTIQNHMLSATQEVILDVLKRNHAAIKKNERYYQDYAQSIQLIDEFVDQPEISPEFKKQLRWQWYQSFMAGLDELDIRLYQGEFYTYVDYLVTNDLKAFAQAHPAEMKKLAAKLLTKVKMEQHPKNAEMHKSVVDTLTKLSR